MGADTSEWDCHLCSKAKDIIKRNEEGEEQDYEEYVWAVRRKTQHTDIFCGNDCNNPPLLPYNCQIDLKDGLKTLLDKNPSQILKDSYLSNQFFMCQLASGGLFPEAGGTYDQPTDFLEFYEVYIQWKEIQERVNQQKSHGV